MPETQHPEPYIPIAHVDRVRGVVGEVVLTVHADDPGRMARLASVFMRLRDGSLREFRIEGVKRLAARAVVKLSGIQTPEAARDLVGAELLIPREASTPAPKGRYYAWQLEGLAVCLKDGSPVGRVREVISQGPQSLLVIEAPGGEILIPMVSPICVEIDPDRGLITIDPPDGLLDLNQKQGRPAAGADRSR